MKTIATPHAQKSALEPAKAQAGTTLAGRVIGNVMIVRTHDDTMFDAAFDPGDEG